VAVGGEAGADLSAVLCQMSGLGSAFQVGAQCAHRGAGVADGTVSAWFDLFGAELGEPELDEFSTS
jgi:hypothetical protein